MAVATVTVTTSDSWYDTHRLHVAGTLAISASPDTYATGGLTVSFAGVKGVLSSQPPVALRIEGIAGFKYEASIGTTIANGKVLVRGQQPTSITTGVIALDEITAAAVPAGVSGDTIRFEAIFKIR